MQTEGHEERVQFARTAIMGLALVLAIAALVVAMRGEHHTNESRANSYVNAVTFRQALLESCERGNLIRAEINARQATNLISRNTLLSILEARRADFTVARYERLRSSVMAASYHTIPLVNCSAVVPQPTP